MIARRRGLGPLHLYTLIFLIFLYAPVLLLPLFSFNDATFAVFPLKGFTLRHYDAMLSDTNLLTALWSSIHVALGVSIVSTLFGLLAAVAMTRYRLPGGGLVTGTILLPLVIPTIILGVGLLVVMIRIAGIELSLWTVAAGHVLVCVPFSMLVLNARLEGFDRSLEEASTDLGERPLMTFWRVTLPLCMPGIVASLLMCFTISFDEYVLAMFLSGNQPTLPVFLYSQLRFPQKLPATLAMGSMILAASAVVVILAEMIRRRGVRPMTPTGDP